VSCEQVEDAFIKLGCLVCECEDKNFIDLNRFCSHTFHYG
jgi:hypothetical protein